MADREERQLEEDAEEEMEAEGMGDMEGVVEEEGQVVDVYQEEQPQELVLMEEVLVDEDADSWAEYESREESDGADSNGSGDEGCGEQYDTTLPSRHEYLGETEELRGRTVQEENDYVTIPLLMHSSLMNLVLVPTQTLPLSIFHPLHVSMLRNVIAKDRTFGIVHSKMSQDGNSEMARYGTTAEIYEYQEEELTGTLSIKAKGRQRFKVMSTRRESTGLIVARVQILPEIRMGNPFEMMRLQSLDKLTLPHPQEASIHVAQTRDLASVRTPNSWRVMGRNAWLTPWPLFVYNQYDDLLLAQRVINEIKKSTMIQPNMLKLPCDPQDLSHWAAINLPLDDSHRLALLGLNTPTQRLRYILSVLSKCKMLTCTQCTEVIVQGRSPAPGFLNIVCSLDGEEPTGGTMGSPRIKFRGSLTTSDPRKCPVLIIGQLGHLAGLSFSDVASKLQPRVDEESWTLSVNSLQPSPTDYCSLYLNLATVAALPVKCSRHNTPSRTHSITKIIKTHSTGAEECIVLVCERADLFASACGVARAYPTFSRKTATGTSTDHAVTVEVLLVGKGDTPVMDEDIKVLNDAVYGVRLAARIVDSPANEMHTDAFIEEVQNVAQVLGIKPLIIRGEELAAKGFGGIYGVGKAALHPPALVVLSHTPPGGAENIAWVGKGIVYDTGGLSIKTKTSMPGMKRDCGGAAAILGAFYVAVQARFTQNLHAVFCLAENAVGPNATKPDDIHTLYSGRTVEINNTDAEGRLVLSDGVAYAAKDLHCTTILDMATLTGAQGTATGKFHGAVITNAQEWEEAAVTAGLASGDLIHPLPYSPELHFAEFASAVADMKNSVADRSNATSSCAGLFIAAHLGFDFPGNWIHIDMAYPVHSGERATGYGVALLPALFGHYSQSRIFRNLAPMSAENGECENDCKASKKMRLS